MTVMTHLVLGAKIYTAVSLMTPLKINKRWFLYGNIYPDISHTTCETAHFPQKSTGYVYDSIESLCGSSIEQSGNLDPMLSMRLGVLCHYISDYFCHVHSTSFEGSFLNHMIYELRQHALLMRHPRLIGRKTTTSFTPFGPLPEAAQGILDLLEEAQKDYLSAPHRADTDLVLAVKMAAKITSSILGICVEDALHTADATQVILA